MKLSWLNTSEARTITTKHISMIWQWSNARHNIKERELESMDQTQTHEYVSRFEHTALCPRLHTEGFLLISSTQEFPHREPPLRIWGKYNREYTTPLSTEYNLSQRQGTTNTKITSHKRGRHLANTNQSPHTWGIPTQPPRSPLHKTDINTITSH